MRILQILPGTGAYVCGSCLRDEMLVRSLRKVGHDVTVMPVYLPWIGEDPDVRADTDLFMHGVSCYLQQNFSIFRHTPAWIDRMVESSVDMEAAGRKAGSTRPADLGPMTVSMLDGLQGNQRKELRRLINHLKDGRAPQVVLLSNSMLAGLIKPLKDALGCVVAVSFQGEHTFINRLPATYSADAWRRIGEGLAHADVMIAPSEYCRDYMVKHAGIDADAVSVIYNGIPLDRFPYAYGKPQPPVLGFLARMCADKGLDTLIEAFVLLRRREGLENLLLRVAGAATPQDDLWVAGLRERLVHEGMADAVEFFTNITGSEKRDFLASISVLSVPATYGEAFGLYVVEALATGVPVVQPRCGAFPELLRLTEGGTIVEPNDAEALANGLAPLLLDPDVSERYGKQGRQMVLQQFSIERMTGEIMSLLKEKVK